MDQIKTDFYFHLHSRLAEDSEYRLLLAEFRELDRQLLEQLEYMSPDARNAALDYLGLLAQLHTRQLAVAVEIH